MADCLACARPQPDVAYVCSSCAGKLGRGLHDAANLVPDLEVTVAKLARFGEPGPRSRGRAPAAPIRPDGGQLRHYADQADGWPSGLPVNLAAAQVREDVANTVSGWCRVVHDERTPRPYVEGPACWHCVRAARRHATTHHATCEPILHQAGPPGELGAAMRWLAGQLEWLRHQKFAGEAVDELGDAARLVSRAVDRPAVRTRFKVGPCPEIAAGGVACGGDVYAVVPVRQDRPAFMQCENCGADWPTMQWARAGRRILAQKNAETA